MAQLRALTHDADSTIGGFRVTFPTGLIKQVEWRLQVPPLDTLKASKDLATRLLQQLLDEGKLEEAERTNWASMTAAIQRIAMDWAERRRTDLRALENSPKPH